ncbi:BTB/POZ domain-containing protein 16 [Biomphalaria pfeifferi]|uniref:BTB/POZ domain-containing protein 16 n=1 Tax=Biomphalaria pfeifferi TaxID=112525 RepID=A0AAD8BCD1_BIOPF|nr:BTB/POZ domain-containing protein 16 [Biomphalaria pfeifferi]
MAEDTKKFADYSNLPSLPPKPPSSFLAYSRYVQDAPYKALVGVVIDAKNPEKFQVLPRHRMRSQTGVTNRWRFPDSLYSDMLGTKQALKSVNMPFNHSLANYITGMYPTCNPHLHSCKEFGFASEHHWSLLRKTAKTAMKTEEENLQISSMTVKQN